MVFIYFFANLLRCFLAIFLWIGGPELLLNGFGWSVSSRSSTMLQSVVSFVSPNVVFVWIPHGVQPPPREKVVWCCHKYVKLKFFLFVCLFVYFHILKLLPCRLNSTDSAARPPSRSPVSLCVSPPHTQRFPGIFLVGSFGSEAPAKSNQTLI